MKNILVFCFIISLLGCASQQQAEYNLPPADKIQLGWSEQQINEFCSNYSEISTQIVSHGFVEGVEVKIVRYPLNQPYLLTLVKPNYTKEQIESFILKENITDPNDIAYVNNLYSSEHFWLIQKEIDEQALARQREAAMMILGSMLNRPRYTQPQNQTHDLPNSHSLPRHITPNGDGSFTLH